MTETKLHMAIMQVRVDLQKKNLKKSGKNSYAGFEYFELADFMPTLNELMLKNGIADIFSIKNGEVHLMLTNGTEQIDYYLPFEHFDTPLNKSNQKQMQDIQYFGALDTYYKRYIYMNAFGITDGDIIDAMDNNALQSGGNEKSEKKQGRPQAKQKIPPAVATGYEAALKSVADKNGSDIAVITSWFLGNLKVNKLEDITEDQVTEANGYIERLQKGKEEQHD